MNAFIFIKEALEKKSIDRVERREGVKDIEIVNILINHKSKLVDTM